MKVTKYIKTVAKLIPFFGMVFLLLLSPCKVRNFIQLEIGTSPTQVSNKSQTTIHNVNCSTLEITKIKGAKAQFQSQKLPFIATTIEILFSAVTFNSSFPQKYKVWNYSTTVVPLYILYQNFKDYL